MMWQCIWLGDGESCNVITSPTQIIVQNIKHQMWGWNYEDFPHDCGSVISKQMVNQEMTLYHPLAKL